MKDEISKPLGLPTASSHRQSIREQVLVWELRGFLTPDHLHQLAKSSRIPLERAHSLLVDTLSMENYEAAARQLFIDLLKATPKTARIAIVTDRPLWAVVASGMGLASSRQIKVFSQAEPALNWAKNSSIT